MLSLFSGSSALWLCSPHTEDLPVFRAGKSPNLPSNYPDIATSSHQQSQAARVMNPDGSEKPPTQPQIDPDTTQLFSHNSGRQYIRGVSNQTGYVKGNVWQTILLQYQMKLGCCLIKTVAINTSTVFPIRRDIEVDLTATVDALRNLIIRESLEGDGTRTQPNSSSLTTLGGENHQPDNFSNTGEQTIEGRLAVLCAPLRQLDRIFGALGDHGWLGERRRLTPWFRDHNNSN
ncbi:hypothetical protein L6164_026148 [Bauhinia variegata]|uniref:Uncharacterized protein n=1 Tax=Bauhinia variegata TaxID=167791 RepID=A0ACB9LNJ9_BAUVA|nr:hypothetical protein L6164_026148 [Bauhinia variegata]